MRARLHDGRRSGRRSPIRLPAAVPAGAEIGRRACLACAPCRLGAPAPPLRHPARRGAGPRGALVRCDRPGRVQDRRGGRPAPPADRGPILTARSSLPARRSAGIGPSCSGTGTWARRASPGRTGPRHGARGRPGAGAGAATWRAPPDPPAARPQAPAGAERAAGRAIRHADSAPGPRLVHHRVPPPKIACIGLPATHPGSRAPRRPGGEEPATRGQPGPTPWGGRACFTGGRGRRI